MQEEQFKNICRSVFPSIKFYRNENAVIAQLPHGDSISDAIALGTKNGAIAFSGMLYSVDAPYSRASLACSPKPVSEKELVDAGRDTGYTQEQILVLHLKEYQSRMKSAGGIRERYERIAKSKWFKEAYENRPLGEVMEIREED